MARFQTVIKSVRFVYSPYTATEMQGFAQVLADSIRARIQSGQNIYDQAAAPLKPGQSGRRGYPDYKSARGLKPIRDWTWSGHTLRCLKVLTANENRGGTKKKSKANTLKTAARAEGPRPKRTATKTTAKMKMATILEDSK